MLVHVERRDLVHGASVRVFFFVPKQLLRRSESVLSLSNENMKWMIISMNELRIHENTSKRTCELNSDEMFIHE